MDGSNVVGKVFRISRFPIILPSAISIYRLRPQRIFMQEGAEALRLKAIVPDSGY